jgi:hypothetical protein
MIYPLLLRSVLMAKKLVEIAKGVGLGLLTVAGSAVTVVSGYKFVKFIGGIFGKDKKESEQKSIANEGDRVFVSFAPVKHEQATKKDARVFTEDEKVKVHPSSTYEAASSSLVGRITYTAIGLPADGPCYMRVLIAVAEEYAGRNFSKEALKALSDRLLENPSLIKGAPSYTVQKGPQIISKSLDALLGQGTSARLNATIYRRDVNDNASFMRGKANAMYSLLAVGTRANPNVSGHWQLGCREGNFLRDPLSGTDSGGRGIFPNETRYVTITSKS